MKLQKKSDNKSKLVGVYISERDYNELKNIAQQEDLDISKILRKLLTSFLSEHSKHKTKI
ncbi:MAG TPA: hypothetical protein P5513_06180 [Candidatus Diapherotrites archaeon]|nr:hypothetical protein [Candidatus Diapherotrites archaeon]